MERNQKSDLIQLGCMDIYFTNLLCVYFFKSQLDFQRLQDSLDQLIKAHIPILSSVLEKDEERNAVRLIRPSNVKIVKKFTEEDVAKLFIPNENHLLDLEESERLYYYAENIEVDENVKTPILGVPLLKVTLLETKQGGHILFVAVNHIICDGFSFNEFMNRWNDIYLGKEITKKYTFDRSNLGLSDPNFDIYKLPKERFRYLESMRPNTRINQKEQIGTRVLSKDQIVTRVIHFSPEKIDLLKQKVRSEKENFRFSTNDCLSAYMWRLHALTYGLSSVKDSETIIPLNLIVTCRSRFSKVKSSAFIGNAVFCPNVEEVSLEYIINSPFSSLVQKVRELVNGINEELVQTNIDCLSTKIKKSPSVDRKARLCMNDWRGYWIRRPHFGNDGNCWRVERPATSGLSRLPFIWNVLCGANGVGLNVVARFDVDVYKKIDSFDLSSFETLELLKKKKQIFVQ